MDADTEPTTPDAPAQTATIGGPEVAAAAERPAEEQASGPRVAVVYPLDEFDSGVKGVPLIIRAGVGVAKSHLPAVRKAAESAGVTLIEEEG